ncbi:MAG: phenylalanine--tRNA ligase subunit alpha [Candidatus Thermoplasmatota archaeon]
MNLDKTIEELSQNEKKVLQTLEELNGEASPQQVLEKGDFNQEVEVMNASSWLQSKKLVEVETKIKTVYKLGKEGKKFLEEGLPEKKALRFLEENNGEATIKQLSKKLGKKTVSISIGWLKRKGWADIRKEEGDTILTITKKGKQRVDSETEDEKILREIKEKPDLDIEKDKVKNLLSRKNVLDEKEIVSSIIKLTDKGRQVLEKGFEVKDEISQINSHVIKNKTWKNKIIRPYDIQAFAPAIHGGKPHPLMVLISKIRKNFLEMGFTEIQGNFVESCFWNMDMLFIPQDHPAREMQDTFYCKNPSKINVKDKKLIKKIKKVHEDGGETGSKGWGYSFSTEEGERPLLRTHTTVNTIRYLYNHPEPPSKVFSIGRVFRKENIDSTHLPEFYQIEGIIHERKANFRQLIGVLREFYKRIGFEKIRFRPGYFPYTEPSMEVEVFWNGEWMELGGSGIFRPEVTKPLGIENPVLAWGLGLERLAMLRFQLEDMRSLYISDLDWMREAPLK